MVGCTSVAPIAMPKMCIRDRVKRRCRAGMGRCQSGFCQSRVVRILARELGCGPEDVLLEDRGSWIVDGRLKEGR